MHLQHAGEGADQRGAVPCDRIARRGRAHACRSTTLLPARLDEPGVFVGRGAGRGDRVAVRRHRGLLRIDQAADFSIVPAPRERAGFVEHFDGAVLIDEAAASELVRGEKPAALGKGLGPRRREDSPARRRLMQMRAKRPTPSRGLWPCPSPEQLICQLKLVENQRLIPASVAVAANELRTSCCSGISRQRRSRCTSRRDTRRAPTSRPRGRCPEFFTPPNGACGAAGSPSLTPTMP